MNDIHCMFMDYERLRYISEKVAELRMFVSKKQKGPGLTGGPARNALRRGVHGFALARNAHGIQPLASAPLCPGLAGLCVIA